MKISSNFEFSRYLSLRMVLVALYLTSISVSTFSQEKPETLKSVSKQEKSVILTTNSLQTIRITPYGNSIIRIQMVRNGEAFSSDNRYEMVVRHDWPGSFSITESETAVLLQLENSDQISVIIQKKPFKILYKSGETVLLKQKDGVQWQNSIISESFEVDETEQFTGLGHGYFGRAEHIDLKGQTINRNYGRVHGDQAPMIVPFFMSSKGYGVFLNSTFHNEFKFNNNNEFGFSINDFGSDGRMDYFFISGGSFKRILDNYTQLTGRPRLPLLSFFGLALSDKGNDHTSADPSDEKWWMKKVTDHRNAGFPLDHVVNDNRWRAGGGTRCESYFDWDRTRYPDPKLYGEWLRRNGLIMTLDLNRCICDDSDGWQKSFNVPYTDKIDFGSSAPDFTKKEVRDWFWNLFWEKSLKSELNYPGDALWIDEFDEYSPIADTVKLGNGKLWGEMKNYWFFLVAKSLVADGWDKMLGDSKRSFVWIRGMTAGAQRYATLWSGDIKPTYIDMKSQIIGLQLAGLSGFPFEGHDQGGFYNWETKEGPDAELYQKWSMSFGIFTPFWKPHGVGLSRWPLDRTPQEAAAFKEFSTLRYQLIPYIYSLAKRANETGEPLARPMIWDYQHEPLAWKNDLQFMFGDNFLVVPNATTTDTVTVWLPEGNWIDYFTSEKLKGGRILTRYSPTGRLVLFVKEGSIIPMAEPALSTAFITKSKLILDVFTGKNAEGRVYDDDGKTGNYKSGEFRTVNFRYSDADKHLTIEKQNGAYPGSPEYMDYILNFSHSESVSRVKVDDKFLPETNKGSGTDGFYHDAERKKLVVVINRKPVGSEINIQLID